MGDLRYFVGQVTFDDSYATGGETITPALFGLKQIVAVYAGTATASDGATSVPVAVLESSGTWKLVPSFVPDLDGDPASAQALAEPDTATDLDAYTASVFVLGF